MGLTRFCLGRAPRSALVRRLDLDLLGDLDCVRYIEPLVLQWCNDDSELCVGGLWAAVALIGSRRQAESGTSCKDDLDREHVVVEFAG